MDLAGQLTPTRRLAPKPPLAEDHTNLVAMVTDLKEVVALQQRTLSRVEDQLAAFLASWPQQQQRQRPT